MASAGTGRDGYRRTVKYRNGVEPQAGFVMRLNRPSSPSPVVGRRKRFIRWSLNQSDGLLRSEGGRARPRRAQSELLDALRAGGDLDVVCEALGLVLQALIDAEATQRVPRAKVLPAPARPTTTPTPWHRSRTIAC
jgi:hypothetical protein